MSPLNLILLQAAIGTLPTGQPFSSVELARLEVSRYERCVLIAALKESGNSISIAQAALNACLVERKSAVAAITATHTTETSIPKLLPPYTTENIAESVMQYTDIDIRNDVIRAVSARKKRNK